MRHETRRTTEAQGSAPARVPWWAWGGWGVRRSLDDVRFRDIAAVLLISFTVWGYVDVRGRGALRPGHPEVHRTDFTVFTEAGSAFFDGRDPYRVTNARGWYYLYPPLFALMVAPLGVLDTQSQVLVWFWVSIALGFGCYFEARRLWAMLTAGTGSARDRSIGRGLGVCVALAVTIPAFECLQRGQLGVALVYPLLLGLRLVLEARGRRAVWLGGVVLAWPVAVKLLPALPVACLVAQQWTGALARRRDPESSETGKAAALTAGVACGGLLWLLLVPAAFLGWDGNLGHLRTWVRKVVVNQKVEKDHGFHFDSVSNQSLYNAAHLLSAQARGRVVKRSNFRYWLMADTLTARRRAADYKARWVVHATRAGLLALLGTLVLASGWRGGPAVQASTFGLACLAVLLISPLAWTHYYVLAFPAFLLTSAWLVATGRPRGALALAALGAVPIWVHYLAVRQVGPYGLLGLATTCWFTVACVVVMRGLWPREGLPSRPWGVGRPRQRGRSWASRVAD